MEALRLERKAGEDGIVHIEGLLPGESVEVIVLRSPSQSHEATVKRAGRLKGSVLKYERPFDPVGFDDWDSLH